MAGYSDTPLVKKLGIRPGDGIFVNIPPTDYAMLIETMPSGVRFLPFFTSGLDFVHLFTTHEDQLESLFSPARAHLAKSGTLWVSWPKSASGIPANLNENIIRQIGLQNGMVDVKVCAVNEKWSALKFVFRLKDREPRPII